MTERAYRETCFHKTVFHGVVIAAAAPIGPEVAPSTVLSAPEIVQKRGSDRLRVKTPHKKRERR